MDKIKRYNVNFVQNWTYMVEARSEDEAESLAYKEFLSDMHSSVANTFYDYYETECLDEDENGEDVL